MKHKNQRCLKIHKQQQRMRRCNYKIGRYFAESQLLKHISWDSVSGDVVIIRLRTPFCISMKHKNQRCLKIHKQQQRMRRCNYKIGRYFDKPEESQLLKYTTSSYCVLLYDNAAVARCCNYNKWFILTSATTIRIVSFRI
jgi:hypothetical protein